MNFNLFLVYFSVFYSKYNYCYEVPENMPIRYFDGTDWKIMKSRAQIKIVPTRSNISIRLDWPESSQENNKPKNKTTTIKKIITKKQTTKRITTKKVINKVATRVTTKKSFSCNSGCILKKLNNITTKGIPRAIKIPNLRTTKRFPVKTTKKLVKTSKKLPVSTTKKPPAKTPAMFGNKYISNLTERNGILNEQQALPDKWLSVIKDLVNVLKVIEEKKNNNQCETESTPQLNAQYPLVDGRRAMDGMDDIMNLLMDGVEIDGSPDDVNGNGSDYSLLPGLRGLSEDKDTMLDFHEIEKLFATKDSNTLQNKDPKLNKNNVQNLDLESIKDALKSRYAKDGDGITLKNTQINAYLDILKSRYANKENLQFGDAPLNLAAINAVIETKHPDNSELREETEFIDSFKESDLKTYLDAKKSGESLQNKGKKAYLDLLKSKYITRDTTQNGDVSLDLDTADPVVEIHNLNNPGFRELAEYKDKTLELDLKSYLDAIHSKEAKKNTIKKDISLYSNEVLMATKHPYSSLLKNIQDDFQQIELRPYLKAMDAKYAAKNNDRSQDIYVTKDKYKSESTSLNLDEIEALIESKHTDTTKTNKHKKHINDKDIKNFFKAISNFRFTKDKSISHDTDITLDLDEIDTNEENNLNVFENIDEDKYNDATDIELEENYFATDDKDERKETDTQEVGLEEDVDWPVHNFKYVIDDGEQNKTRENNAFTSDYGGEIFQRPETRPTLAP